MKGGISNHFGSDSVNEDVIFAIGMSLAFVGSGFRNTLSKTNISNRSGKKTISTSSHQLEGNPHNVSHAINYVTS